MCAMKKCVVLAVLLVTSLAHAATDKLTIVKAGPVGELAQLSEGNEVRVIFSEPMVDLGRIPKVLTVPWFHMTPEETWNFPWSGTTTLIFTPTKSLPFAPEYEFPVDHHATLGSNHR